MNLQRLAHWLSYFAARTVICIVQAATIETCAWWSGVLAWLAYDVVRLRRDVIDDNLRHAFPEWDERRRQDAARRMWRHLFLLACEIAHAPRKIHETTWRDYVTLHRSRELVDAFLSRRPMVLVFDESGAYARGLGA